MEREEQLALLTEEEERPGAGGLGGYISVSLGRAFSLVFCSTLLEIVEASTSLAPYSGQPS